jgi:hypothetical protein
MSKEDIKKQKDGRKAYLKMQIVNKKLAKLEQNFGEKDKQIMERIKRSCTKKGNQVSSLVGSGMESNGNPSRVQTAKDAMRPKPKFNMFQITKLMKKSTIGNPIVEELSNSDQSFHRNMGILPNKDNSASGSVEPETGVPKERNVLYLKQGRGKLKMEGMYGISRRIDKGNEMGSQSDLLEDIPLSIGDEDGNTDDREKNSDVYKPESEIMFPLDSSFSDSMDNGRKKSTAHDKNSKGKNEGESA